MVFDMHLVFKHHMDARQRCIATALAKTIDSDMEAGSTGLNSHKGVANSHIVVVMSMELKLAVRVAVGHSLDILIGVVRVEDTECVREQIAEDALILETIHHLPDIIAAIAHTLRPVLQIEVDVHTLRMGIGNDILDVSNMLLRGFLQLVFAMAK